MEKHIQDIGNNLPFTEQRISTNTYIREFKFDTECGDFAWHRDRENRIIEAIHDNNWLLQIDNQLPQPIIDKIFIPKGVYHRLIKGVDNLKLKVTKLKDNN